MSEGLLTQQETRALLKRARAGDRTAEETLVSANLALVKSVVKKYLGRGVEYDDLYQLGCMGLVKAVQHFDTAYEVRFSTYAVPMIAGEIKRFLRDDGMVKVSRSLKELAIRAMAQGERLHRETGREPGVAEIAAALGVDAEEVALALDAGRPHVSLNEPVYEDEGAERQELIEDGASEGALVDRLLLKELLCTLEPREKQIILLRYFRDKTQSEIARQLGVSQVQVSRLESRILKKLRDRCNETPNGEVLTANGTESGKKRQNAFGA
ncbi:MAG: SigB/SigF/SigG family RNA polymerase sigma factor [Eubacteriales bacterium]|nr:SigB/SigF/SigG family RNA polymerase sigma factor [Eubacteriales bacterium]